MTHLGYFVLNINRKVRIWNINCILSVKKKKVNLMPIMEKTMYTHTHTHTYNSNIFSYNFLLMWQHDEHSEEAEPRENTTCRTGHV